MWTTPIWVIVLVLIDVVSGLTETYSTMNLITVGNSVEKTFSSSYASVSLQSIELVIVEQSGCSMAGDSVFKLTLTSSSCSVNQVILDKEKDCNPSCTYPLTGVFFCSQSTADWKIAYENKNILCGVVEFSYDLTFSCGSSQGVEADECKLLPIRIDPISPTASGQPIIFGIQLPTEYISNTGTNTISMSVTGNPSNPTFIAPSSTPLTISSAGSHDLRFSFPTYGNQLLCLAFSGIGMRQISLVGFTKCQIVTMVSSITPAPPTPTPTTLAPTPVPPTPAPPTPVPPTPAPPTPAPPTPAPPTPVPPTPAPPTPAPPTPAPPTPVPPTPAPPTPVPPTPAPPTPVPPTPAPPTPAPPTPVPPTPVPPTPVPPTPIPPTPVPPTPVPPTPVPPTLVPPTPVPPTPVPPTPIPLTVLPTTQVPPTLVPTPVPPTPMPLTPVPLTVIPTTPLPPVASIAITRAPLTLIPTTVPYTPLPPTPGLSHSYLNTTETPVGDSLLSSFADSWISLSLNSIALVIIEKGGCYTAGGSAFSFELVSKECAVNTVVLDSSGICNSSCALTVSTTQFCDKPVSDWAIKYKNKNPLCPMSKIDFKIGFSCGNIHGVETDMCRLRLSHTSAPATVVVAGEVFSFGVSIPVGYLSKPLLVSLSGTQSTPTFVSPNTRDKTITDSGNHNFQISYETVGNHELCFNFSGDGLDQLSVLDFTKCKTITVITPPQTDSPSTELNISSEIKTARTVLATSTDTTSVFASVSSVASSTAGGSAGMLAVTLTKISCNENAGDSLELPMLINPLHLRVDGVSIAGAVVGNILICISAAALLVMLTALLSVTKYSSWNSAASVVRCPSALYMGVLFFFSATLDCSADLVIFPRTVLTTIIGICGILFTAGCVYGMWRMGRKVHFESVIITNPAVTSSSGKYIIGSEGWTSMRDTSHTEKYGVVFDIYRDTSLCVRGRFLFIEVLQAIPLTILGLTRPGSHETCAIRVWMMGIVFFVYGILCSLYSPFLAPFLNHLVPLQGYIPGIAMVLFGCGHLSEDFHKHWTTAAGTYIAIVAMYIALLRACFDIFMWLYEVRSGIFGSGSRYPRVQEDYSFKGSDEVDIYELDSSLLSQPTAAPSAHPVPPRSSSSELLNQMERKSSLYPDNNCDSSSVFTPRRIASEPGGSRDWRVQSPKHRRPVSQAVPEKGLQNLFYL